MVAPRWKKNHCNSQLTISTETFTTFHLLIFDGKGKCEIFFLSKFSNKQIDDECQMMMMMIKWWFFSGQSLTYTNKPKKRISHIIIIFVMVILIFITKERNPEKKCFDRVVFQHYFITINSRIKRWIRRFLWSWKNFKYSNLNSNLFFYILDKNNFGKKIRMTKWNLFHFFQICLFFSWFETITIWKNVCFKISID